MHQRWADYRVFWRQFRQAYNSTGAVLPSGRGLSRALTHFVRAGETASAAGKNGSTTPSNTTSSHRRILEVGPGTGAVTLQIIHDMQPTDRLVLVERNEQFVNHLNRRLSESAAFQNSRDRISILHSSLEDLPQKTAYDLIISGLPLNNFPVQLVEEILTKFSHLLAPGGTLSFFEYVAIRRAKSLISSNAERERLRGIEHALGKFLNGSEIRRDLVLANVPPAWVHHVRISSQLSLGT